MRFRYVAYLWLDGDTVRWRTLSREQHVKSPPREVTSFKTSLVHTMTTLRILDCTLRDGGFYTNWNFRPELVRALVSALDQAGVDIIELGYRSPRQGGKHGLFKYCDESAIASYLPSIQRAQLAFMIDVKEVQSGGEIDTKLLADMIGPRHASRFAWARVASHPETIEQACDVTGWLRDLGYAVAINVMGASSADSQTLARVLDTTAGFKLDALYLADSFGNLTPERTSALVAAARRGAVSELGVHLHDNLGLALANALSAIDAGATFIDTTVAGMGRGAGNVRTEQLLAMLVQRGHRDLDPGALVPMLNHHMQALHDQHRWGPNYAYMVSALSGIHPTYCQELEARGCYDLDQIVDILQAIPPNRCSRFDQTTLLAVEARHIGVTRQRRSS
jgi:4-hydroxy 2-oxovalerate aldolase